jgi:hypothetical protein
MGQTSRIQIKRRDFLQILGAGVFAPLALRADIAGLKPGTIYYLKCLGNLPGLRYLDGRTQNRTVGLVKELVKPFTGTKWRVFAAGGGAVSFQCLGNIEGARWLDGRTTDGSVGLAPNRQGQFTGTRWEAIELNGIYMLKCLGTINGPRWLDGRTQNGSVALANTTDPPFTGTKWEIRPYPACFDDPCNLP